MICTSCGTKITKRKDAQSQQRVGENFAEDIAINDAHRRRKTAILARGHARTIRGSARMTRIHLVLLWHMHQPQYRDPATGRYVLPWTRLHALKDYWGMVRVLEEFPDVHATFNVVPSLAAQLEEYASGKFDEPWFTLAFSPADQLTDEDKAELLMRGFQANPDHLIGRWPRYKELFERAPLRRPGSGHAYVCAARLARSAAAFAARLDGRGVSVGGRRGEPAIEEGQRLSPKADKQALRAKQLELAGARLARVSPRAGSRADRNFHHAVLPSDSAAALRYRYRAARPIPERRCPAPAFRHPRTPANNWSRARAYHERLFGAAAGRAVALGRFGLQ